MLQSSFGFARKKCVGNQEQSRLLKRECKLGMDRLRAKDD